MTRIASRRTTILIALKAAVLLLACSADDNDNSAPEPSAAPTAASRATIDRNRALLDSLGAFPGALLVREYVKADGAVGREFGTLTNPVQAATDVTVFYRDKLKAQGWETAQEQAVVSAYTKGGQSVTVMRYGSTTPAAAPDQKTTATGIHTVQPSFYFAIEAS